MRAGRVRLRRRMFESRVARRVFGVFVVCALLPVTVFSLVSQRSVSDQLRAQTDRYLHRAVKASGMMVLERLRAAQTDLELLGSGTREDFHHPGERLAASLEERFRGITWIRSTSPGTGSKTAAPAPPPAVWGEPGALPSLTNADRARLAKGESLVRHLPGEDGAARVILCVPVKGLADLLVGDVKPSFLWSEGRSLSEGRFVVCLTPDGDLIYENGPVTMRQAMAAGLRGDDSSVSFDWSHDGEDYLGRSWLIFMRYDYDTEWILAESEPVTAAALATGQFRQTFLLTAVLTFLCVTILSTGQIRRYLVPIERLKAGTERISKGVFDQPVEVNSKDEFQELAESFNGMAGQIHELLSVRQALIDVGIALTAERDTDQLERTLLSRGRSTLSCDAAVILVANPDGRAEQCLIDINDRPLEVDAADIVEGAWSEFAAEFPTREAKIFEGDVGEPLVRGFLDRFDSAAGYKTHRSLWVPLFDQDEQLVGLLLLLNPIDRKAGERTSFRPGDLELAGLLGSQASAALTKNRLVQSFKELFDGMIDLIAAAIDEKSPHTGQHCQRVPVLTEMLARAVCEEDTGPLADFQMSDEEWYELHVAAMLHDCGKVATPVHVMDKSRKLEKLFDRIEVVQARFEILRRDLRIAELEEGLRGAGLDPEQIERAQPILEAMEADLQTLEHWNVGGEFMPPEAQDEVRDIATRYSWTDRRGVEHPMLSDEEVENLVISRGTLTQAERKIIENHVVSSIRMLERLPYPKNLRRVPLIAGAHHERMDGKGYPGQRRGADLPLQARILGVADVFEALTAKDRPYKPARPLSQSLFIMAKMREEGHIDPDIFEVFVTRGVFREYAAGYVEPEAIDEVDISTLPGCAHLVERRLSKAA